MLLRSGPQVGIRSRAVVVALIFATGLLFAGVWTMFHGAHSDRNKDQAVAQSEPDATGADLSSTPPAEDPFSTTGLEGLDIPDADSARTEAANLSMAPADSADDPAASKSANSEPA